MSILLMLVSFIAWICGGISGQTMLIILMVFSVGSEIYDKVKEIKEDK